MKLKNQYLRYIPHISSGAIVMALGGWALTQIVELKTQNALVWVWIDAISKKVSP